MPYRLLCPIITRLYDFIQLPSPNMCVALWTDCLPAFAELLGREGKYFFIGTVCLLFLCELPQLLGVNTWQLCRVGAACLSCCPKCCGGWEFGWPWGSEPHQTLAFGVACGLCCLFTPWLGAQHDGIWVGSGFGLSLLGEIILCEDVTALIRMMGIIPKWYGEHGVSGLVTPM